MREMSAAMQREMEKTRTELRNGILELPQETAESAAQMRRVIVEQIDALAELNRIVARHSRDTVEQSRRAAPSRWRRAARARDADARQARRSAASRCGGGRCSPPPRRGEPPPQPPPHGGRGRGGWLDRPARPRLARGERACAARPTAARRAAPWSRSNSLSVDIARMIDHDAAAELWERYKRGERNVFTRRLYTMQGQKTFEEIRNRYRGDREFSRRSIATSASSSGC